jgi:hypothetical protein
MLRKTKLTPAFLHGLFIQSAQLRKNLRHRLTKDAIDAGRGEGLAAITP